MSTFDFDLVRYTGSGLVWSKSPRRGVAIGSQAGSKNTHGYVRVMLGGVSYSVHGLVWELHHGPIPDGYEIDHINGIRSDNSIGNLRIATRSQNCMNHKTHRHNKLGIKGVSTRTRGNCIEFVGRVAIDGKVHMKSSTCLDTVLSWLKQIRPEIHGEFANGGYH